MHKYGSCFKDFSVSDSTCTWRSYIAQPERVNIYRMLCFSMRDMKKDHVTFNSSIKAFLFSKSEFKTMKDIRRSTILKPLT